MDLKDKTTEKLNGELKGLKMINGALIGVLSLLFIVLEILERNKHNV